MDNNEILETLLNDHKKLNVILKTITHSWQTENTRGTGTFYYVDFRDGQYNGDIFVDYLSKKLPFFCLPKKDIEAVVSITDKQEQIEKSGELYEKAKSVFRQVSKRKKKEKQEGEPGELILFCFLEWALSAPQVVAKMSLKTDPQMPVHGADGIHIGKSDDMLLLYFGESKLYKQISNAINDALESCKGIAKNQEEKTFEIKILRDHLDLGEGKKELAKEIYEHLDPYSEKNKKVKNIFSCFIGFDFSKYSEIKNLPPSEISKKFEELYLERIKSACALISKKIKEKDIQDLNFHFFLLPFQSVEEFRTSFYKKIGLLV